MKKLNIFLIVTSLFFWGCKIPKDYYIKVNNEKKKNIKFDFMDGAIEIKIYSKYFEQYGINSVIYYEIKNSSENALMLFPAKIKIHSKFYLYEFLDGGTNQKSNKRFTIDDSVRVVSNTNIKIYITFQTKQTGFFKIKKNEVLTLKNFGIYLDGEELIKKELNLSPNIQ